MKLQSVFFSVCFRFTVRDKSSEKGGTEDSNRYRDQEKETDLALMEREKKKEEWVMFFCLFSR